MSEINTLSREFFLSTYAEHVRDADLLAQLTPDYPCLGKRTLQDDGTWFRTLRRDNVELVRDSIEEITARSIRTVEGDNRRRGRRHHLCHRLRRATHDLAARHRRAPGAAR